MSTYTLTDENVGRFAKRAAISLALFEGQYAQMQPHFPTITEAALKAMIAEIQADPLRTSTRSGIDHAVYFAAVFVSATAQLRAALLRLERRENVVNMLFLLTDFVPQIAGAVNALTLLSRGGLMPELHLQERAPIIIAKRNANKGHAKGNAAKAWVRAEWLRNLGEYKGKPDFARVMIPLVLQKFDVKVTAKTICERWL